MLRSPPKDKESTGLEDLKNMIRELFSEFQEVRKEQKEYREEIEQLKRENKEPNEIVGVLKNRIEVMEKDHRKNNVIIKGINTKNEGQLRCSEVEAFIEANLKIKVKIIAIREIKQTT